MEHLCNRSPAKRFSNEAHAPPKFCWTRTRGIGSSADPTHGDELTPYYLAPNSKTVRCKSCYSKGAKGKGKAGGHHPSRWDSPFVCRAFGSPGQVRSCRGSSNLHLSIRCFKWQQANALTWILWERGKESRGYGKALSVSKHGPQR